MLKIYGRFNEYIEFGTLKQEYNEIIISYLNYRNIKDALDFIKANVLFGVDTITDILKKVFFKYATLFMRQNPIETMELLDKYFIVNNIQNIDMNILQIQDDIYILVVGDDYILFNIENFEEGE